MHHNDPFDRLLVAQALHEPARLLTVDPVLRRYSDLVEVLDAKS
jgi:PIN domain nuclease of toxin-antitoxin system